MAAPEPPLDPRALEGALREAFGSPPSSVLDAIERITGTRSSVLLRDAPEDASPVALSAAREPAADDSRYQVLGEIARGGIGVVYKGRDRDLNREVALKVLRREYSESPEVLRRFVEEAQIGGQLQHPGLVPVYGMGLQPDGRPYFAMRLIKGETLTAMMPRADRARLVAIFEQVAQTVAYAHSRGVVHRDLKPSNVMVGAFGEVQVVDWGFAKVLGRKEEEGPRGGETIVATVRTEDEGSGSLAGSIMGTPAYMPPEQALGHVDVLDERSDVFALGAILCEMLTGEPVYGGGRSDQILAAAQARVEDALQRVAACDAHGELKSLARDCLAPLPKDRPAHAGAVAQRVHDHLASVEERARSAEIEAVEAAARAERERHRRRRTILVATALLLAVGIGGAAFFRREAEARARAGAAAPLVAAAMREATAHEGAREWPLAAAAAAKAVDLAETAGADRDLLASARDLAARVRDAQAAADAEVRRRTEDEHLLAALDDALAPSVSDDDAKAVEARVGAVFAGLGFDLAQPHPIAERLKGSHVAAEIAADFDAWAKLRKSIGGDWKPLDELARAIDPVDANDAFRDACLGGNLAALREAVARADVETVPGDTLAALGTALSRAGDREGAVAFLRRARDRRPGEWRIHANLSSCLVALSKPGAGIGDRFTPDAVDPTPIDFEASRAYAAVVALKPRSAAAWNGLGSMLSREGDLDGAFAALREALRLDPDLAPAWYNLAYAHLKRRDYATAIPAYREALRRMPDLEPAHSGLSHALLEAGDAERAAEASRERVRLRPDSALAHGSLASALLTLGRIDEAIAECREAIRLDPTRFVPHMNLGLMLLRKADPKGAVEAYREGVRLEPEHAAGRRDFALALRRAGLHAQALEEVREAIRLKPDFAAAHCLLGNLLFDAGDHDGAMAAYRAAIRVDRGCVVAYTNLAVVLRKRNEVDAALEACREAVRIRPESAEAHFAVGVTLQVMGNLDGCIAACQEALRLQPNYPEAWNEIGTALAAKRKFDDAIEAYRKAIELRPEYAVAHRNLGQRLHDRGDVEGAFAAWHEAIRIDPNLASAHGDLGHAYVVAGDNEKAVRASREAIRLDGNWGGDHLNLGLALSRLGEFAEALPHLHRARELGEPWNGARQRLVEDATRMAALEPRLKAVLEGAEQPKDTAERVDFVRLCSAKKRYADAVRLLEPMFGDPALESDPKVAPTFSAACAAAMAGGPQWRARALEWLRADLAALENRDDRARALAAYKKTPLLASVRDRIDELPEAERGGWRKLWADVDARLAREGR